MVDLEIVEKGLVQFEATSSTATLYDNDDTRVFIE